MVYANTGLMEFTIMTQIIKFRLTVDWMKYKDYDYSVDLKVEDVIEYIKTKHLSSADPETIEKLFDLGYMTFPVSDDDYLDFLEEKYYDDALEEYKSLFMDEEDL